MEGWGESRALCAGGSMTRVHGLRRPRRCGLFFFWLAAPEVCGGAHLLGHVADSDTEITVRERRSRARTATAGRHQKAGGVAYEAVDRLSAAESLEDGLGADAAAGTEDGDAAVRTCGTGLHGAGAAHEEGQRGEEGKRKHVSGNSSKFGKNGADLSRMFDPPYFWAFGLCHRIFV